MEKNRIRLTLLAALCAVAAFPAAAVQCVRQSPPHAVALLELYTSEGCDSCPPADRWLSRVSREGPGADSVVPLALHVDYWDRLGWKDRFGSARYSERQQELARAAGSRAVYTPGVFLNLEEFRGWSSSARFLHALREVNAKPAKADIRLTIESPAPAQLAVKANFKVKSESQAQAFLALYENRLRTEVRAGENRGATLHHDYVVRELIGPIRVDGATEIARLLTLGPDWKAKDLGLAAFVQSAGGREILQATALNVCSPT